MSSEAADWVRQHDDLELLDYTRDGYRTIIVAGSDEDLRELMVEHDYIWRGGLSSDGEKVLVRAD